VNVARFLIHSAVKPRMPTMNPSASALRAAARILPLLATLAAAPAAAQALSPEEARIVAWIDAHADSAVALLERSVNVNSGTMNPAGVRRVGEIYAAELDEAGFATRWIEMPPEMNRAGHLFAERSGDRGKKLLLIGHLDTVFEEDSPFQRFVREGGRARGPGINDMKGGNVVIAYALRALHAAGALDGTQVIVALTGDEESAGSPLEVSRGDLIEAARRSDLALEFETASRDAAGEYAVIARRSSSGWTLTVRGRTAHSSGVFSEGVGSGAIYEAARILAAFHDELAGEQYLTFNPGFIVGGTDVTVDLEEGRGTAFGKTNVVAQTAVVRGDLRTLTDDQLERARARMREIVARHLPRTEAEIEFQDRYPSMPPTEGNRALLSLLNEVNRDLGTRAMEPFDPGRRGAADISFVAPYVDGLAGLGVHGGAAHSPDEWVDLETIPLQIKRAALLIYRLTR
jgi:glutamate carboxypeptidase